MPYFDNLCSVLAVMESIELDSLNLTFLRFSADFSLSIFEIIYVF